MQKPRKNMSPDSAAAIGRRLRWTRKAMGYSQTQIARMCGISVQRWNNNEAGRDRMNIDAALALSRKIGVGLDWIYQGLTATLTPDLLAKIDAQQKQDEAENADNHSSNPGKNALSRRRAAPTRRSRRLRNEG